MEKERVGLEGVGTEGCKIEIFIEREGGREQLPYDDTARLFIGSRE